MFVTVALVLLGLGWSATTVAGSTLLTEASAESQRTRRQGLSDLTMSLVAALGAILAGVVLAWIGYGGLALVVGVAVDRDGRALAVRAGPRGGHADAARPFADSTLEPGLDQIPHDSITRIVQRVDDRDQPPLVEHRARMRQPEHDQVAEVHAGSRRRVRTNACWSLSLRVSAPASVQATAICASSANSGIGSPSSYGKSRLPASTSTSPGSGCETTRAIPRAAGRRPVALERRHRPVVALIVRDVGARAQHEPRGVGGRSRAAKTSVTTSGYALPPAVTITSPPS